MNKILKNISLAAVSVGLLAFSGCLPDDSEAFTCGLTPNLSVNQTQLDKDIEAIDNYLSDNNITAEVHDSGLRYVIDSFGNGVQPNLCNAVSVNYKGSLISDGSVFDESNNPVTFPLSNLITGWQIGIPLVNAGGSITLFIPSVYGYGQAGAGNNVPPNANLIFEIDLLQVQ
ncbi:MAG: FKBP-type peptidyl-prolyl cis-trans isomerase [Fulvivirga sp.]